MDKNNYEIIYDIIDFASDKIDSNILNIVADEIPGIKLIVNITNSISDKIFHSKVDKFIKIANEFNSSKSFEKFKIKISNDEKYKNRVTEYLLFKINKFDEESKIEIFSKACSDFFNGNIIYDELVEISEIIDYLNKVDIEIIKYLHSFNGTMIKIEKIIDEIKNNDSNFKIYASISKLINFGLILEELNNSYESLNNKLKRKVTISPLGCSLFKYL